MQSEIPEDVMKAAKKCAGEWNLIDAIARAILAERDRCEAALSVAETVKPVLWANPEHMPKGNYLDAACPCQPNEGGSFTLPLYAAPPALSAQVQDVAGWKPIETAPKDGTTILGYGEEPCRRGGSHVRETRWEFYGEGSIAKERFKKGEGPSGSWGWQEPIHNWASSWEPTHWQPLPAAPAKQEGRE